MDDFDLAECCGGCADCCDEDVCMGFCGLLYCCNTCMNAMNTCMMCSNFFGRGEMSDYVGEKGASVIGCLFCVCVCCVCLLAVVGAILWLHARKQKKKKEEELQQQIQKDRNTSRISFGPYPESSRISGTSWAEYVQTNIEDVLMLQNRRLASNATDHNFNRPMTEEYGTLGVPNVSSTILNAVGLIANVTSGGK